MKKKDFFKEKHRWSYFKDMLLEKYLPIYFSKILKTNKKTVYIDGFAGKGRFDDGSEGSPIIVSKIIDKALNITKSESTIIPYFVEYEFADELRNNLNNRIVVSGDYKIEVPNIIKVLDDNNVFLYVDPFGIKHLKFEIFNMLQNKNISSSELLLNLNAFGYLREGCRLLKIRQNVIGEEYDVDDDKNSGANDIINMNSIANGDYWIEILKKFNDGIIDIKQAEQIFVNEYMKKLRKIFRYVLCVPIRTGEGKVPKYRMIFGSNNIDGFLLMANTMFLCDQQLKLFNNNNESSLFDYIEKLSCKDEILSCVTKEFVHIKDFCVLVYQKIGVKYSHKEMQDALKELENEGKILVKRDPELTPKGKRVRALTIMNNEYTIGVKLN